MSELEAAEPTPECTEPEQQIDPAALKILGSWRTKATPLYVLARIGASAVLYGKTKIVEIVQGSGTDGFSLYLANREFDDECELLPSNSNANSNTKGFAFLWRLRLKDFQVSHCGRVITLHSEGLEIELSERLPSTIPPDNYYRLERIRVVS